MRRIYGLIVGNLTLKTVTLNISSILDVAGRQFNNSIPLIAQLLVVHHTGTYSSSDMICLQ